MKGVAENRKTFWILLFLFLAWVVGNIDKMAINVAMIPIAEEFSLDSKQTGLILSVFFLGYTIMQLLGGWLADKYGSRNVLISSLLLWSVFTGLTGAAWSFTSLLVIRFLFGFGEGSFPSASTVAIAENVPKNNRAKAKSILLSASVVGAALGTILSSSIITAFGWKSMFFVFGVLGIIICFFLWIYLPKRKKGDIDQVKIQTVQKVGLKQIFREPMIWSLFIMWFGMCILTWGLSSWSPSYWIKVRNLDMVSMGFLTSIPLILGFFSTNFSGWMLDKYMRGRERYWGATGALIGGVCLYFMFQASTIQIAIIFQCISTIAFTLVNTTVFSLPLKYFPQGIIGSATGIINFGGQMAGVISPSIIGFIISASGGSYNSAMMFLVICSIIPVIASLTINTKKFQQTTVQDSAVSY
ncbi:MAG: MFS transporter [Bacillota bacterium]